MWNSVLIAANTVLAAAAESAADAPPANGEVPPNPLMQMLPMLIVFGAIMYFLMIRPNQKREKERKEMLASLSKGDKVVTNGGICGTVVGLNEKSVVLRISEEPSVKVEFLRGAVARVERDSD